jgi:hypothetical protein
MINRTLILIIDAVINIILGILLILVIPFPKTIPNLLGLPAIDNPFYPSIMGGVFIGIGVALGIEAKNKNNRSWIGLGLGGAVVINMCGGLVLLGWLIFGNLPLPLKGYIILWTLAVILIVISTVEFLVHQMYLAKKT